jgi:hypothetical protein
MAESFLDLNPFPPPFPVADDVPSFVLILPNNFAGRNNFLTKPFYWI